MDNFLPDLTFVCLILVGLMVNQVRLEVKALRKLLEDLKLSQKNK
jgi:hypothetical protein